MRDRTAMPARTHRRGRFARYTSYALAVVFTSMLAAASSVPVKALATPEQRVLLISDSVGLGTRGVLDEFFPSDWDVRISGTPANFVEQLESNHAAPNLGFAGDHVIVAGGYNYPFWDPERFDRSIDSMVNRLTSAGVKNVYWVTLREVKPEFISASAWRQVQPYYWYFPTVNEHLEEALQRHPNLTLIDWAAVADQPDLTYDAIHLNRRGAELYSQLIANAVSDATLRSPNDGVTRVAVPTAAAGDVVAINVTSTRSRLGGFVTAYSCDDDRPDTSTLNHGRNQTIAASAVVPLGPSGEICVYTERAGHVLVDIFGSFRGTPTDADVQRRVLDTRRSPDAARYQQGVERVVNVAEQRNEDAEGTGAGDPPAEGATAEDETIARNETVALNVTVLRAFEDGFLTVHTCGESPDSTSNVNFGVDVATPNLVVATADADGNVCFTATSDAHVLVDVITSFGATSGVDVATPERLLDTRPSGQPSDGQVVRVALDDPAAADGVFVNLTIVRPATSGFATVYSCSTERPPTSNVNYAAGRTVANFVTAKPEEDGELCVYTSGASHVIVDLLGTTGSTFDADIPQRLVDTRNP